MKKTFIILTLILFSVKNYAQESVKKKSKNEIFFAEISSGKSLGNGGGGYFAFSLNYQKDKNIFTYKSSKTISVFDSDKIFVFYYLPIIYPLIVLSTPTKLEEDSFLYGRRYIKNNFSYSFSGGISHTKYRKVIDEYNTPDFEAPFIGFPFEINVRWFKSSKKRIRLLELFPIGKPTGFGGSMGIKLFGNISKQSYIGIGVTFGLGYYKNYN